ncbi:MAG: hypothetical protein KGH64_05460 [Candidatus Micrarchaeota archaeon]|nr:hypothetical protein [Candidatus Micrarchaeota archaeon]
MLFLKTWQVSFKLKSGQEKSIIVEGETKAIAIQEAMDQAEELYWSPAIRDSFSIVARKGVDGKWYEWDEG